MVVMAFKQNAPLYYPRHATISPNHTTDNRTTYQNRTTLNTLYDTACGPYCKLVSPMVGNGLVPYDDLYHEYPERQEQTKYIAAAPNKECESVSFVSALSFGMMYADPLASVYPSQLKKDIPHSDNKKQTFVPVRLRMHGGRCARGRGRRRGRGRAFVGLLSRYLYRLATRYTLIGGREKNSTFEKTAFIVRRFYVQDCRIAFTRPVDHCIPDETRVDK